MKGLSPETRQVLQYLESCYYSQEIATYQEIARLTNQQLNSGRLTDVSRNYLSRARASLQADKNMVFETLTKIGVKGMSPKEVVSVRGKSRRNDVTAAVNRWQGDLRSVNPADLDQPTLNSYVTQTMQAHALESLVSKESTRKLEEKIAEKTDPLSWAKNVNLLEAWG